MRFNFLIILTVLFFSRCTVAQDCPQGINLLPMYGKVKKCSAQLESDQRFLKTCDENYANRKVAAKDMVKKGWKYYYQQKPDTAMMRFNQAWLLDSLNADVYWGFANLVGSQGKLKESLPLFSRSLQLDPYNATIWESASNSYGQLFAQTRDVKYLHTTVEYLKKAIQLKPNNARAYSQLTAAYCYFTQKDSARKYLQMTDRVDKNVVHPDVRKMLQQ